MIFRHEVLIVQANMVRRKAMMSVVGKCLQLPTTNSG